MRKAGGSYVFSAGLAAKIKGEALVRDEMFDYPLKTIFK